MWTVETLSCIERMVLIYHSLRMPGHIKFSVRRSVRSQNHTDAGTLVLCIQLVDDLRGGVAMLADTMRRSVANHTQLLPS